MTSEKRAWDLVRDGWFWREAAHAVDDPEFQTRCELLVGRFNETLEGMKGVEIIAADCAAAAFIRKARALRYESAHARIAASIAKEHAAKADPSLSDSARIAGAFPSDSVLDRFMKFESFCDRQAEAYLKILRRLWESLRDQQPPASRRPPRPVDGEASNQQIKEA